MGAPEPTELLVISRDPCPLEPVFAELKKMGYGLLPTHASPAPDWGPVLASGCWALALVHDLEDEHLVQETTSVLHRNHPDLPIIVIANTRNEEVAGRILRSGAAHLLVPGSWERLLPIMQRELRERGRSRQLQAADGQSRAVVGQTSARVRHERLLQENQAQQENPAQLQEILERVPMGVVVVGLDRSIRWANPLVLEMAGIRSLAEIVGRQCNEVMCPAESGQCPVLDLGETIDHCERLFRLPGGATRPILKSVVPITLSGEKVLLETFIDIGERKAAERKSLQSQKLESIGQLAAGIAHEINTPIQYIGDNTRFLGEALEDLAALWTKLDELNRAQTEGAVSPDLIREIVAVEEEADLAFFRESAPESIAQALEGIERVATIVRALKNFAHPGSTSPLPTDINAAIDSTVTVCRNEWKYVAELVLDLDEALPAVTCVAGQINQVLLNMTVNAAHAIAAIPKSPSDSLGKITITTRTHEDRIVIHIADTGSGIPEAIRERIFDPFFTTKEVGKGTGQGLAIAHDVIVNKHGGSIDFESEIGRGTRFRIELPISGRAYSAEDAA